MDKAIRDLWWIPVVRGISSVVFGILVLVWPNAAVGIVALLFAATLALYGIADIIVGVQTFTKSFSGILRTLFGFLEIGIVIYLFKNAGSGLTLGLMGLLMAVALVLLAVVMVGSALLSDAGAGYRWAIGLAGAITLFVGISVARAPVISIASVIWVLGIYGLIVGPIEIAAGFMLKNEPAK